MNSEKFLIETSLGNGSAQAQLNSIDGQTLRANVEQLISLIQQFGQDSAGNLELDEVTVAIKVTAEGKVVLLGDGQNSSTGAMTLRFRRPATRSYPGLQPITPAAQPLPQPQEALISASGVNYSKLKSLLSAKKWQEANQETWNVMCQALGKNNGSYLLPQEITQISCEDLQTIDRLWQEHSQGRFGFSVQKKIYSASTASQ